MCIRYDDNPFEYFQHVFQIKVVINLSNVIAELEHRALRAFIHRYTRCYVIKRHDSNGEYPT